VQIQGSIFTASSETQRNFWAGRLGQPLDSSRHRLVQHFWIFPQDTGIQTTCLQVFLLSLMPVTCAFCLDEVADNFFFQLRICGS
jgi:hypothetical protein